MSTVDPKQAFQSLGAEDLAGILAGAKQERKDREDSKGGGTGGGGYIPTGYPQAGVSKIRIFLDPERKLYRSVKTFKLSDPKKRVMDPRFFNGKDPSGTEVPKELTENIWKLTKGLTFNNAKELSPAYTVLAYVHLIETDKPDDKFWKPGTTYIMAGNGKFEEALLAQISSLSKGVPAQMANALNPTVDGWAFEMTLVKGQGGSVSLTPTIGIEYPGIELTPAYKPLREQFVEDNLNLTDMTSLVDALKAKRIELDLDEAPPEEEGEKAPTPPPGSSKEGESKPEEKESTPEPKTDQKSDPIKVDDAGATGGGAAGDSWEEGNTSESSTPTPTPTPESSADEETYNLSPEQIVAAKAANIGLKQFAELMGLPV